MARPGSGCGRSTRRPRSRWREPKAQAIPFWSPDSRSVGFFADGKLKRIDIGGGSPQTLTNAASRGGTWSPDGVILFTPTTGSPLFRIPASGGEAVAVTKLEKQTSHRFPQFLPGGRQFLFYAQGTPETQGIYLGSLDAPETKRLTAADTAGVYAPAGWLLFIRGGTLLAQRLDLTRRELTGDPVTVADPVAFDGHTNASAVSVSAAGLVAYRSGGANRRQLTWFDRAGKALGTVGAPGREWSDGSASFARRPPGGGAPHGAGQHRHLAPGRGPHDPLHLRRESRSLSHLVAGREPDRVRLEPEGSPRPLSEAIERRRERGTAGGIAAGQNGDGLVGRRPVHPLSQHRSANIDRTFGCCHSKETGNRLCF